MSIAFYLGSKKAIRTRTQMRTNHTEMAVISTVTACGDTLSRVGLYTASVNYLSPAARWSMHYPVITETEHPFAAWTGRRRCAS